METIYHGMPRSAEAIESNFNEMDSKIARLTAGDLPKGSLTPKTGFAIKGGSPWYRVKNGVLQLSCNSLSVNANIPAGAWKDVCSLNGAGSINSTGDTTITIMNGNNANYIGARARVVNGVLRILPESTITPTQYMNDFIMLPID
nr:MAG TPA: nanobody L06, Major structural protein, Lactococcus lactis, Siphoviridae, receptor.7A [Caudoviricetes sp.]